MIRLLAALSIGSLAGRCASFGFGPGGPGARGDDLLPRNARRPAEASVSVAFAVGRLQSSPGPSASSFSSSSKVQGRRPVPAIDDGAATPPGAAVGEDDADAHLRLGHEFQRKKDLAAASNSFRRAVELLEQRTDVDSELEDEARFRLGKVLSEMGHVDDAVATFRHLVSKEEDAAREEGPAGRDGWPPRPRRPSRAGIALANVLLDGRGARSDALAVFRAACDATPTSPMAVPAGVAADSLGDFASAVGYYRSALECDEGDGDAVLHLMIALLRRSGNGGGEAGEEARALWSRLPDHVASSVDYVFSKNMGILPSVHFFTYDMINLGLDACTLPEGLVMEFGVYHGKTLRMIARHFSNEEVHGFDTFEGIPEDWHRTPKGSYSTYGMLPGAPGNVRYHVGLFAETLPPFLEGLDDGDGKIPVRFMNIDCDLYSSTRDVLTSLSDRVMPGTVIIFDEYVQNPNWKLDEYRALQEAAEVHGWEYEYLGISLVTGQAVVRIL